MHDKKKREEEEEKAKKERFQFWEFNKVTTSNRTTTSFVPTLPLQRQVNVENYSLDGFFGLLRPQRYKEMKNVAENTYVSFFSRAVGGVLPTNSTLYAVCTCREKSDFKFVKRRNVRCSVWS